jgi:predicted PurR-regulated permease PerM
MLNKAWVRTAIGLLLAFLLIKYFLEINHIFYPIIVIVNSIALPLLLGGFLYYITVPFQNFLENRRVPRWGSLIIIILLMVLFVSSFVSIIGPLIVAQVNSFIDNFPQIQRDFESYISYALDQREKLPEGLKNGINDGIQKINDYTGTLLSGTVTYVTKFISTLFLLILVPFFLIYMLKDHDKFIPFMASPFSGSRKKFVVHLFKDIDKTLKSYIQGQVTVSIILGLLLLIGYLIIGLEYSLVLALWGMITNLIPFLGPYLAVIPALVIALIQDPIMVIYVIIIMFVAQQLEGNVITPNIIGKSLSVHPLTVITVILAAGNLGGFFAILIAVPTYAVLKTIVTNFYKHRQDIQLQAQKVVKDQPKAEK